jgi:hypothetical protein
VAADVDRCGSPYGGLLRRAARLLLDVPGETTGCAGCGAHVEQPPTGRPRRWCSERCRRRRRR